MNNCSDSEYEINEFILRLVQPYSEESLEELKQDLIASHDLRVVRVWNGYHLDDIYKYNLCEQCNLDYVIEETDFLDLNHAAVYVCKKQLQRTDLSSEYQKYLIGQRYNYEHEIKSITKPNNTKCSIADSIASESFVAAGTVRKYGLYALAINEVFAQDTTFAKCILSGKARISHENIIELARLSPDEIRAVAKTSMKENVDHITLSYIRNEVKWSHIQPTRSVTRRERSEARARSIVSIRQMPEYDPDAEVNSLCFTIDSWISSIQRVKDSNSFPRITNIASLKLMKKLTVLEHTINTIQDSLVERTSNESKI